MPNLEGLVLLPDERIVLLADNQSAGSAGPAIAVVLPNLSENAARSLNTRLSRSEPTRSIGPSDSAEAQASDCWR